VFPKNLLHTPHINLVGGVSTTGLFSLLLANEGSNNLGCLLGELERGVPDRLGDPGTKPGVPGGRGVGVHRRFGVGVGQEKGVEVAEG